MWAQQVDAGRVDLALGGGDRSGFWAAGDDRQQLVLHLRQGREAAVALEHVHRVPVLGCLRGGGASNKSLHGLPWVAD